MKINKLKASVGVLHGTRGYCPLLQGGTGGIKCPLVLCRAQRDKKKHKDR